LSDVDWKKTTTAEKWTVGVTAHHLASAYEAVPSIVTTIASGGSRGHFTTAMLDGLNARHAIEHAGCTKSETIALLCRTATSAASVVRGLGDDQLAKSGIVFDDTPPMTAEQLITRGLIEHTDEHLRSIRETVGTRGA
jgi:Mycothiol maleylpyruvate isomerase N-terminal domain